MMGGAHGFGSSAAAVGDENFSTNCGSASAPGARALIDAGDTDGGDTGEARPSRGSSAQVFNINLRFRVTFPILVVPALSLGKSSFRSATVGLSTTALFAMALGATT
jgi:hypothetical protein